MALKQYSKALDFVLCAVAHAKAGHPVKAAKALADALLEEDFQPMVDGLSEQNQDMQDQMDDLGVDQGMDEGWDEQEQETFSKALSRLMVNSGLVLSESEEEDEDDSDDADSNKEETAQSGDGFEGVTDGGDATDVTIEHAEAKDEDDDMPAFLKKKDESKVMIAAKARIDRAARIAANQAAVASASKKVVKKTK